MADPKDVWMGNVLNVTIPPAAAAGRPLDLFGGDATKAAVQKVADASSAADASAKKTQDEARDWVKKYLADNNLGPDINGDGSGKTVMFCNRTTPLATVIERTVAAVQTAKLASGDAGRNLITKPMVAKLVTRTLVAAVPKVPGNKAAKSGGEVPDVSLNLQYTFTPETTHTTSSGAQTKDQPAHAVSGTVTVAFHGDNESGWEISGTAQVTWFADDSHSAIQTQSALGGAQVAWVWSFLDGALTAGPMFQVLAGASRAQQKASNKLEWEPTGQVGLGGQVQYAIPGFNGHVMIGFQAGASGTVARGAEGTVDQSAALTFTYKF